MQQMPYEQRIPHERAIAMFEARYYPVFAAAGALWLFFGLNLCV